MTETPKPISKETPTGTRPPVKWMITVKETDSTVVVQFPVSTQEVTDKQVSATPDTQQLNNDNSSATTL